MCTRTLRIAEKIDSTYFKVSVMVGGKVEAYTLVATPGCVRWSHAYDCTRSVFVDVRRGQVVRCSCGVRGCQHSAATRKLLMIGQLAVEDDRPADWCVQSEFE